MQKRQLIINNYKTAEDGLFTLSACTITKASQEQSFVKVPGRFAPLDLSTVLTDGQPYYGNAKLKATLESSEGTREERQARIEYMKNLLDGYTAKIIHPDFPGKHLVGRVEVTPDFNGIANCAVKVNATLEPWLYNDEETVVQVSVPDESNNLFTSNELNQYGVSYDKGTQVLTVSEAYGTVPLYSIPDPIPAGTKVSITVKVLSGMLTNKYDSFTVGGYHRETGANSWQCSAPFPNVTETDLSGRIFSATFVTTDTVNEFLLYTPLNYCTVHEPLQMQVQYELGEPTEWKPYTTVGGNNLLDIPDTSVSGSHAYTNVEVGDFELAPGDYTLSAQYEHKGPRAGQISVREYGTLDGYLNTATLQPGTSGKAVIRFTVPEGVQGIRIYLYSNVSATHANTSVTISDIMVNKGSTALPYEPFYAIADQLLTLTNEGRLAVVPVVDVVGSVSLTFDDKTHALSAVTYQLPDLYLTPGKKHIVCSGKGTATVTYREAVLAG